MNRLRIRDLAGGLALSVFALLATGCQISDSKNQQSSGTSQPVPPKTGPLLLQGGDSIEVDLTGTPQPYQPMTFNLADAGLINLPLLTNGVTAIGKTPHELEGIIRDRYINEGWYTSISVTVTPGLRYYYVSGALNPGGSGKQPYTGKVTVLGAISAVGGFNSFAARYRVQLTRQDGKIYIEDCNKALKDPGLDLEVLPNDKIFVDQLTLGDISTFKK